MSEAVVSAYKRVVGTLTQPGAEFELAEAQVFGRTLRVYRHASDGLPTLFRRAEAAFAGRELVVIGPRRLTYGEVFMRGRRLGAALQDRCGVRAGDHIAIAMANGPEWIIALAALTTIGAVAVLVNARGAAAEVASAIQQTGCRLALADARRASMIRAQDGAIGLVSARREGPQGTLDPDILVMDQLIEEAGREADAVARAADDAALVMFTSGTGGKPKGAVITERNLVTCAMNLQLLFRTALILTAEAYGVSPEQLTRAGPAPASLLIFPLFHTSGLSVLLISLLTGGRMVILPRWDAATALDLVEQERLTSVSGPPLVMTDMLAAADLGQRDLSSLTSLSCGGQATPPNLSTRIGSAFPTASQGVGWGMTELTGSVTGAAGPLFAARPGSCGPASPVMDLKIFNEDGIETAAGAPGEIWARGPLVMKEYWDRPDANASAFQDGWFKTGDVGFLDAHGFLIVVDRKKDMLICGGENIYCAEVEQVIATDPDVLEVALVGLPDERLGERPVAAVTPRPGGGLSEAGVKAAVRAHLAEYKTPRQVVFDLGPLRRNGLGKIDKAWLRSTLAAHLAAGRDSSAG